MVKPNQDIRDAVKAAGIYMYSVAETMNVSTTLFCQWLQRDLSPEKRARIENAIAETVKRKRNEV